MTGRRHERPICNQYGLNGHRVDMCYKLHGYSPGFQPKPKTQAHTQIRLMVAQLNLVNTLEKRRDRVLLQQLWLQAQELWTQPKCSSWFLIWARSSILKLLAYLILHQLHPLSPLFHALSVTCPYIPLLYIIQYLNFLGSLIQKLHIMFAVKSLCSVIFVKL